jgi:hypothetical protein
MTRGSREEYHFAPLTFETVGEGVRGLFDANPRVMTSANPDGPTRAFVAGYVTHLVLDEIWITEMFRPCFGNPSVYKDEARGHLMDRAMQLELDRRSQGVVAMALPLLAEAKDGLNVGFIPSDTLSEWREWVVELVGRGFTWERLRFMAQRMAAGDDTHPPHRMADDFLRAMPSSLDVMHQYVTANDLTRFKETVVEKLAGAVGEYLR